MAAKVLFLFLALFGSAAYGSVEEGRPVTKVINMLKDMQKQLEKEGEEDEDVYDKLMCWCQTNDREKTQAIADAEEAITNLGASIEELTATAARLTAEIANGEAELAKNNKALDKATAIRQEDLAAFNADEKDTLASIASMKGALQVLSKQNSFLQLDNGAASPDDFGTIVVALNSALRTKKVELSPADRRLVTAFLQGQQPASAGSYAPQSGAIFGVLKNMKESFEAGLANSQKEEMQGVAAYEELKAAKEDEIESGSEQVETKKSQLAGAEEKCATDKQALADTTAALKADRDFMAMLKSTCASADAQMEERQKQRAVEIEGVSKALAILSSDEAHDLFTKTFNPAFVQLASVSEHGASLETQMRTEVAKSLLRAAKKHHNSNLALLATKVKLAQFTEVKKSIDTMIADLETQKANEVKLKDFCVKAKAENAHTDAVLQKDKAMSQTKIKDLTNTIETLETDIEALQAEIAEMQIELAKAKENRSNENKEFQQTVADQRATQQLIASALEVLKGVYGSAALVQMGSKSLQAPEAGGPPPPGFKTYEKSSGSGGVMGLMEGCIAEAKALEQEAVRGEESAQSAYEDFVKDTQASVEADQTEIANKKEAKGKAEGDKAEAEVTLDSELSELQNLANERADLGSQCDFVQANFDVRQEAFQNEADTLKQAKQQLEGAAAR